MSNQKRIIVIIATICMSFSIIFLVAISVYDHMNRISQLRQHLTVLSRSWVELRERMIDITPPAKPDDEIRRAWKKAYRDFAQAMGDTEALNLHPNMRQIFPDYEVRLQHLRSRWKVLASTLNEIEDLIERETIDTGTSRLPDFRSSGRRGNLASLKYLLEGFRADAAIFSSWIYDSFGWLDLYMLNQLRGMEFLFFTYMGIIIAISFLLLHTSRSFIFQEALYLHGINSLREGIILSDSSARIIFANSAAERLIGSGKIRLQDRNLHQIIDPDIIETAPEELYPYLLPEDQTHSSRVLIMKHDGRILRMESQQVLSRRKTENGSVHILDNVSSTVETHAELEKKSKLEYLGKMATGIAHDFNNNLMTILGNIELAILSSGGTGRTAELLKNSKQAIIRSKELVHRLLAFSGEEKNIREKVLLKDIFNRATGCIPPGSRIKLLLPSEQLMLESVEGDLERLSEAVEHILRNSAESANWKGTIAVSVRKTQLYNTTEKFIRIAIQDDGQGIRSSDLPKIFDPFFTTKAQGRGFGLSIAYSIIKQHGGTITVESEEGKGTTLGILLPEYQVRAEQPGKPALSSREPKHILLMDDEKSIREVGIKMLIQLGHSATAAENGEQAIELFRKAYLNRHPFDAVILDLSISDGMNGIDTMKMIRTIDPEIQGIISTGLSNDPVLKNFHNYGFANALPKPYDFIQLSSALSDLFSDTGSPAVSGTNDPDRNGVEKVASKKGEKHAQGRDEGT